MNGVLVVAGTVLAIWAGFGALAQEAREYRRCDATGCRMVAGHLGAHR